MSNYNYFAFYYDILTQNINYSEQCQYLCDLIDKFGCGGKILVDLACGTGSLSELMHEKGFEVIGIDNSEQMLSQAMDKKYDSGSDIIYLKKEMQNLDLFWNADNNFIYDCDEVYCVWQNSAQDDNLTKIELDLFVADDDGSYKRYYETFCERAYTHEDIVSFADNAKLDLLALYDENSFDALNDNSQRAVYVLKNSHDRLPPQNDLI